MTLSTLNKMTVSELKTITPVINGQAEWLISRCELRIRDMVSNIADERAWQGGIRLERLVSYQPSMDNAVISRDKLLSKINEK